jgi:hypothetical protein
MRILLVLAVGLMLLALVMIPVARRDAMRIAADARPITGTILRVEETHHPGSGSNASRSKGYLVWVSFTDPATSAVIERPHVIQYASSVDEVDAAYPVGQTVRGFHEPGGEFVLLRDTLPEPHENTPMLAAIAGASSLVALGAWIVLRRRRGRESS